MHFSYLHTFLARCGSLILRINTNDLTFLILGGKVRENGRYIEKVMEFLEWEKLGTLWLIILPEFEKHDMNLEFNLSLNGNVIHMCN